MSGVNHNQNNKISYKNSKSRIKRSIDRKAIRKVDITNSQQSNEHDPANQATDQYIDTSEEVLIESARLAKKDYIKGKQKLILDRKNKKPNEQDKQEESFEKKEEPLTPKPTEKEASKEEKGSAIRYVEKDNDKESIQYQQKGSSIRLVNDHQSTTNDASIIREEQINNAKKKFQIKQLIPDQLQEPSKSFIQKIKDSLEDMTKRVGSKAMTLLSNPYTGAVVLIGVVIVILPGTISMLLSSQSSSISGILPLSEDVLAYEDTINHYAEIYGVKDYVPLIEAIMMVESKGLGNDPMDASLFEYNTRYPGGIEDPEYSIDVGIHQFSNLIQIAECTSNEDNEHLYLAIQSYDYGKDYISWANDNFNGFSEENAKVYYQNVLNQEEGYDPSYVSHVLQYIGLGFGTIRSLPNWNNTDAYIKLNPYAQSYMGQCTWFAWGRFYDIYGYSPGFTGGGMVCVDQLVAAHPDKFVKSNIPKAGAVFSAQGRDHVGIVLAVEGNNVLIQDGNQDLRNNTYIEAQSDYRTITYTLDELNRYYGGVVFANPIY